jgi:predicted NUDIX family phosphoesterase
MYFAYFIRVIIDETDVSWVDQSKIDNYDEFESWSALILQAKQ